MNAGVLHQVGAPREIYRRPATSFVARFIGRSNVLAGTVEEVEPSRLAVRLDGGEVLFAPIVAETLSARVSAGDQIALSVRPETMRRSEEHTSELQSRGHLVCRLLLEKKKQHKHSTYK